MTDKGVFTDEERAAYVSDPCSDCGAPTVVDWHDVSLRGGERQWMRGLWNCTAHCLTPIDLHWVTHQTADRSEPLS